MDAQTWAEVLGFFVRLSEATPSLRNVQYRGERCKCGRCTDRTFDDFLVNSLTLLKKHGVRCERIEDVEGGMRVFAFPDDLGGE